MTEISSSPPVEFPPGQDGAAMTAQQPAIAAPLTVPVAATSSTRATDDPAAGPFLKPREMAALLRVSRMTIYRLIRAEELEAIRVGRSFRIPEPAARSYLAGGRPDRGDTADPGMGSLLCESACDA